MKWEAIAAAIAILMAISGLWASISSRLARLEALLQHAAEDARNREQRIAVLEASTHMLRESVAVIQARLGDRRAPDRRAPDPPPDPGGGG